MVWGVIGCGFKSKLVFVEEPVGVRGNQLKHRI